MAKVSIKQRELKRAKTVRRFAEKRAEIKERARKGYITGEGAWEAMEDLQKLPRNASPARRQHRCNLCGRPHGVYRKFGLCRCCLRKFAMKGFVPGLSKASW